MRERRDYWREYLDAVTGQRLAEREEFVEALSHDCWVVQVPLLAARRRTDLERLPAGCDNGVHGPVRRGNGLPGALP